MLFFTVSVIVPLHPPHKKRFILAHILEVSIHNINLLLWGLGKVADCREVCGREDRSSRGQEPKKDEDEIQMSLSKLFLQCLYISPPF